MSNIQMMWLFYGLLPCLVVISYCEGASACQKSVYDLKDLEKTASSSLSTAYGANNIKYSSGKPWVANFSWPSNRSNNIYFEFNFKRLVHVPEISYMSGGDVEGFRPNMTGIEKCFVTRFTVEYKTSNKSVHWTMLKDSNGYKVKFDSDNGIYAGKSIGINQPITALKLVIRRWHNCPAVKLDLRGCDDIDECSGRPNIYCGENTNCQNTRGGFNCTCQPGFTGDVTKCSDVNECTGRLHNCHKNADCFNTEGSFRCSCKQGYTGTGTFCADIDECGGNERRCGHNATCQNVMGGFECKCHLGFTGDGTTCSDVNECQTGTVCDEHAYCNNTIGSYSCTCKQGFSGDGKTCSGRKPIITEQSPPHQTIRFGKNLQLYCQASGLPLPIMSWSVMPAKKASIVNVLGSEGTDYVRSVLTINSVSLNDSRRYTCAAVNSFGKVVKSMNIAVDGTPGAPNLSTEVKVFSIILSWIKPDSGASEITQYIIRYKDGSETKKKEEIGTKTKSTLDKLKPKTTYTISVVAVNDQGESDSSYITNTTNVPEPPGISEPPKYEKRLSETSVRVRLTKINDRFVTHIQIIVQIKSSRKKREVSDFPEKINNYQEAEKNGDIYYITGEVKKDLDLFDVGDGRKYGNYANKKLRPEKSYNIYLRGVSYNSEMKPRYGKFSPPLEVAPYKGIKPSDKECLQRYYIPIALFAGVLIGVGLHYGFIRLRSRRKKEEEEDDSGQGYEVPIELEAISHYQELDRAKMGDDSQYEPLRPTT